MGKQAKRRKAALKAPLALVRRSRRHVNAMLCSYKSHLDTMLGAGADAVGGELSLSSLVGTTVSSYLDCYATLGDCLRECFSGSSNDFDQMSQAAGPSLFPSTGAATGKATRVPSVPLQGPAPAAANLFAVPLDIPAAGVVFRQLVDGRLHVTLVALPAMAPGLPAGEYDADVQQTRVSLQKVIRERTPASIGFGAPIPADLMGDSELDLQRLLFE